MRNCVVFLMALLFCLSLYANSFAVSFDIDFDGGQFPAGWKQDLWGEDGTKFALPNIDPQGVEPIGNRVPGGNALEIVDVPGSGSGGRLLLSEEIILSGRVGAWMNCRFANNDSQAGFLFTSVAEGTGDPLTESWLGFLVDARGSLNLVTNGIPTPGRKLDAAIEPGWFYLETKFDITAPQVANCVILVNGTMVGELDIKFSGLESAFFSVFALRGPSMVPLAPRLGPAAAPAANGDSAQFDEINGEFRDDGMPYGGISINGGEEVTQSRTVRVDIDAYDNESGLRDLRISGDIETDNPETREEETKIEISLSEGADPSVPVYERHTSLEVILIVDEANDERKIYATLTDRAGNENNVRPYPTTIRLNIEALRLVVDIPDSEYVMNDDGTFDDIHLDECVSGLDDHITELQWEASGTSELVVSIDDNRVATITPPNTDWVGNETITFTAIDPMTGLQGADTATFTDKSSHVRFGDKLAITWGAVRSGVYTFDLGQNYPNPFNPDTWIPYQLADDVGVDITIYNISGKSVQTLNLGFRQAGLYIGESRAAYWDGRNKAGEQMSSGVYFYTIQAGDFIATRKMILAK